MFPLCKYDFCDYDCEDCIESLFIDIEERLKIGL
jgi:hypothetical protein